MRGLPVFAWTLVASAMLNGQSARPSVGRTLLPDVADYTVASDETFETIGVRLGVDPVVIARRNTKWVHASLSAGTKLTVDVYRTVPSGLPSGILVNVAQKRLFLIGDDNSTLAMPVAVGRRDWPTPRGSFRVVRKELNPTWDVPPSIQDEMIREGRPPVTRVPPGPQNPLGQYWIGLSLTNIGIHATNAPASIPGFTTHGCIRVGNEDIKLLFERVSVGTPGEVIDERALLTWYRGRFFVEVHPAAYRTQPTTLAVLRAAAEHLGVSARIDWRLVNEVIGRHEGFAIDVTLR